MPFRPDVPPTPELKVSVSGNLAGVSSVPIDPRHAALAVASRRQLLAALRSSGEGSSGEATDVAALAATVGLHVTTVRFHLDVLERAGLVRHLSERTNRPGRPRQLYVAVPEPAADEGPIQLAAALAGVLAGEPETGQRWAERAGRQWAEQQLSEDPLPEQPSWEQGTRQVAELFDRLGFAPRLVDDDRWRHFHMAGCPFRALARDYTSIVCTVHQGLLRGALGRLGVPSAEQAKLRPFVRPELCIADVPKEQVGDNRT
jgi:predicted ArsR family transcriptional regulator